MPGSKKKEMRKLRHIGLWFYLFSVLSAASMILLTFRNYFSLRQPVMLLTFVLFLVLAVYVHAKRYEKRARTICAIFIVNSLALWFFFSLKSILSAIYLGFLADILILISALWYVYILISSAYHFFKFYA